MIDLKVLANLAARNLAGNGKDRRRTGICRGETGRGIVKTRAGNHEGYARFA